MGLQPIFFNIVITEHHSHSHIILYFDLVYVTAVRCVFTREKVKHGFLHPFFPGYLSNVSPKYLEIKSAPHFLAKGISLLDSLDRGRDDGFTGKLNVANLKLPKFRMVELAWF